MTGDTGAPAFCNKVLFDRKWRFTYTSGEQSLRFLQGGVARDDAAA
jgi:hypothetical protein